MDSNIESSLIVAIICFIVVIAIMFGSNACTASEWNNGICPKCQIRYELRGVSNYSKYYVCPKCGQEVSRY